MQSKSKPAMTTPEREWVSLVKLCACSVCDDPADENRPSEAHEINQGQWFTSIALCSDCHRGSRNGLHGERRMWALKKLDELGALNITIGRVFDALRRAH